MSRVDAEIGVIAQVQYDGAMVQFSAVGMGVEKPHWRRREFSAEFGDAVGAFTGWHADLHGISPEAGLQRLLQTGCHLENWD
jgi:hypothetical protein